ncbi:ATP-grasp domain-containing protein [Alkaliphilus sp. B6464]|uniref:ATP-grasp domain-containing protein n=1 Tax=Alkaliphilus sp. B6464 TaxID=2731219 RepID=UPI001BA5827B|nr:ATP-grasp domain-containing protein [Alkaliphilus sp. B6464]QUH22149.1 ATP-grasp domain-containing protein [Alkaliphilus sp. B6464]
MKTFLIQTIGGNIKHDFCFQLIEAVNFINWYNGEKVYNVILSDYINYRECIPVGSLEFVFDYIEKFFRKDRKSIKPINIPDELFIPKYLKRDCCIKDKKNIIIDRPVFIKSMDAYKSFTEIINDKNNIPEGRYLVSEVIDIESEWRGFVLNGKLVGLNNYLGDFTLFPDILLIKEMINSYKNCPPSYTIDVGVNQSGTFIIEVHPFVSCGLYGFRGKFLPTMFNQAFNYIINN